MACIPISFPPSSPMPKLEPSATPRPSHAPSWQLPNLGNHPTYRPSTNGVQKRKQTFQLPHRPKGSVAHLAANEQIAHLRQSRKAIKSKLYSRISRLQQELDVLQQEYYADPSDDSTSLARAPRFWPSDHAAKPRDLFAHDLEDLHRCNYSLATRPRRMVRFDAPQDEILIYTSASCLNQHTSSGPRSAASACIFKVTGLPLDESRSLAFRLENKGPTGQEHPQEANRAHLRAAIAALQNRPWREEGWSAVTIASDSEYVVEGITNWIEVWQENGWHTSRDTMNIYEGGSVANRDLWELLLSAIVEHKQNGVEIKFWLILHELNAEAHTEARTAAELLKEEEDFYPFPHNLIKVQPGFGPEEVRINSRTSGLRRFD